MFKVYTGAMPVVEFATFEEAEKYIVSLIRQNYYLLNNYIETPSGAQIKF